MNKVREEAEPLGVNFPGKERNKAKVWRPELV